MHPSLVALLLGIAIALTLFFERQRGVVEPYKYKQLEEELEREKNNAKYWLELSDNYKEKWENLIIENHKLKREIESLKDEIEMNK